MPDTLENLKQTPLYEQHRSLGARLIDFGGWALPVFYRSIIEEHRWVRASCGFFDVSHLGQFRVTGDGAFSFLQQRLTNDLRKLKTGRIQYSFICNEEGYVLDDILVYQSAPNDYYLVVNACNIATDLEALKAYAPDSVTIHDQSDVTAAIAVQGPKSEEILNKLFGFDFEGLGHYAYQELHFAGKPLWVSRSGYTGEKGFEIFCSSELALQMWSRLCDDGKALGALPAGLGARNTLRLEAGNPLYGHELDRTTTPIEAGFEFAVCFDKGGFVGGDAILTKKMRGIARKLVGIRMNDKAVARDGYPVFLPGSNRIGHVTSGSYGPSVDANIGMAYVLKSAATLGTSIEIEIHGRRAQAQVVATPFIALKHRA